MTEPTTSVCKSCFNFSESGLDRPVVVSLVSLCLIHIMYLTQTLKSLLTVTKLLSKLSAAARVFTMIITSHCRANVPDVLSCHTAVDMLVNLCKKVRMSPLWSFEKQHVCSMIWMPGKAPTISRCHACLLEHWLTVQGFTVIYSLLGPLLHNLCNVFPILGSSPIKI